MLLACALITNVAALLPPSWLDQKIAGYVVAFDQKRGQTGVYDKKKGFYLVRGIDCDGAHIRLLLTRDRKLVDAVGYKVHKPEQLKLTNGYQAPVEKPLSSLSTGKGVKIGDTTAAVIQKLGQPTKVGLSGYRNQFKDYHYTWSDVKNGEGVQWANRYTFKEGKLIEIEFTRDAVPGCGEG